MKHLRHPVAVMRSERGEIASWMIVLAFLVLAAAGAAVAIGAELETKVAEVAAAFTGDPGGGANANPAVNTTSVSLPIDPGAVPDIGDDDHDEHDDHADEHDHELPVDEDGIPDNLNDGTPVADALQDRRQDVVDILNAGNDDRLWDSEVEDLLDLFDGLSEQEAIWLWESLSDEHQAILWAHFDPSDPRVAALLDLLEGDYPLEIQVQILDILNAGDDDRLTDDEVRELYDLFNGLTDAEAIAVWESLSDEHQLLLLSRLNPNHPGVAALLDVLEGDYPLETRADIIAILDHGNDDRMSEDEVQDVLDLFDGLTEQEAAALWESLSRAQRERLIDNLLDDADLSDPEIAGLLDLFVDDYPLETRAEILTLLEEGTCQDWGAIGRGSCWLDRPLSEEEVAEQVLDLFDGLNPDEAAAIWDTLSEDQQDRLIDYFLDSDPTDAEIAEFLDVFEDISDYALQVIGEDDPEISGYDDALAAAEAAVRNDSDRAELLADLTSGDSFEDLDYHQQTAVLSQFTNYDDPEAVANLILLTETESFQELDMGDAQRAAKSVTFLTTYEPEGGDTTVTDNTLALILGEDAQIPIDFEAGGGAYGFARADGSIALSPSHIPDGNDPIADSDRDALRVLTHTVAHEVSHVLNEDRVDSTFDYFMGEYRAYYVGQTARYGREPTRAEVEDRLLGLVDTPWVPDSELAEGERHSAYSYLDLALQDPVEGPKIAEFVSEVLGREVTVENVVAEVKLGPTDPDDPATLPLSVDGGPNNLTNERS